MILLPFMLTVLVEQYCDRSDWPLSPKILVLAAATQVESLPPHSNCQRCTFLIQHVYAGESGLKGRHFTVEAAVRNPFTGNGCVDVPLRPGEVGIWPLAENKGRQGLFADIPPQHLGPRQFARRVIDEQWPALANRSFRYSFNAVQKWADVVEEVHRNRGDRRVQILRKACVNTDPLIARWAIDGLATLKPSGYLDFLRELATDEDTTLTAQVLADCALSKADPKRWLTSKDRVRMLERWVNGQCEDDDEALLVMYRLRTAVWDEQLDETLAIQLQTCWAINQPMSSNFRFQLFQSQGVEFNSSRLCPANKISFEFALNQIQTSRDRARKLNAARWLREVGPYDKAQMEAMQKLAKDVPDGEIAKLIEQIMKEREKPRD